jgi:transcriptional regulator with XRE-family HTH domain
MGWSQSKLGNVLGVSFQQVRKYEKGTNRIAASRLQNVAEILEVPVALFKDIDNCSEVLPASESLDLVKAFMRIGEPRIRRRIIALIEQIGNSQWAGDDLS